MNYKQLLDKVLNQLFLDYKNNWFYDEKNQTIIRWLNYEFKNNNFFYTPDLDNKFRYPPFALMWVSYSRKYTNINKYDNKIKSTWIFLYNIFKKSENKNNIWAYWYWPLIYSLVTIYSFSKNENFLLKAKDLIDYYIEKNNFSHNEDWLFLLALSEYYLIKKDKIILNKIKDWLEKLISNQNNKGLFILNNSTTKRHQNQMYTIWGIANAIKVTGKKEFLKNIEKNIEYTIKNRLLKNWALIWEDVNYIEKTKFKLISIIKWLKRRPHWEFLFECHQTFFINSIYFYYQAWWKKNYNKEINKAFNWLTKNNILNTNLIELSSINLPIRFMTIDWNINYKWQNFKWTYEIWSYIMTLTNIIKKDFNN